MEMTKRYRWVKEGEQVKLIPRYRASDKEPDYTTPRARSIIQKELRNMAYEVKSSTGGSSTLVKDDFGRVTHRSFTKSNFPKYMGDAGISSTSDFLRVLSKKKGVRFERLKTTAIDRLENGFQNEHGYDTPSKDFLVASRQLYDNKDVVFRRVRGRIIPMRIPYDKRGDLTPF